MRSRCRSLFLALTSATLLSAQDLSVLRKSVDRGDGPVVYPRVQAADTGTIVLDDALSIRFRNVKPEFLSIFFERHRVIRFGSEQDILRHGRITVPGSLDPAYDQRLTPHAERDGGRARPNWYNVRLDHFTARRMYPDGTWEALGVLGAVEREEVRTPLNLATAWTFVLDIEGIRPGDVVEVHWKYMIPYDLNYPVTNSWRGAFWVDNWSRLSSWRVFFHGELPVRRQRVEFVYRRQHGLVISGCEPDSIAEDGDDLLRAYIHADLPGCTDEVNARLGEDLPHLDVTLYLDDPRNRIRERLSGMIVDMPAWAQVARSREAKARWWERVSKKRVPDKQNMLFKAFIENTTAGMGDRAEQRRIEKVHETIALEFDYDPDMLWYRDREGGLERMGDQVTERVLRDISRYNVYSKLIYSAGLDYRTAYVLDARIGRMTDRFLTPLWDAEMLFGVRDTDGGMLWMHPKRQRHGLLANELPFYWQGTSALLVDVDALRLDAPPEQVFVELPMGDPGMNQRNLDLRITLDLERATATATADLLMAGQFSTLCRSAFLGGRVDSTIMPVYGHRPDRAPQVQLRDLRSAPLQTDPPFRQAIRFEMDLGRALAQVNDTTWTIDLADVLCHMVPSGFEAATRDLPFHWDFPMQEVLAVSVKADRNIDVEPLNVEQGKWSSATAELVLSAERSYADASHVRSALTVGTATEPVATAGQLQAVLDHALALKELVLMVRERRSSTSSGL